MENRSESSVHVEQSQERVSPPRDWHELKEFGLSEADIAQLVEGLRYCAEEEGLPVEQWTSRMMGHLLAAYRRNPDLNADDEAMRERVRARLFPPAS